MCSICIFFFFKQKTAYEMRISDWSSDVCSSDISTCGAARLDGGPWRRKLLFCIAHHYGEAQFARVAAVQELDCFLWTEGRLVILLALMQGLLCVKRSRAQPIPPHPHPFPYRDIA